ncbi:MAG: hypothetical protein ACFFCW_08900 [Candidatus Hodarchaeota archaeon]
MAARKPLDQIIERAPALIKGKDVGYLQDTINLEESIEPGNREETVRLYYFAKTLKSAFEEILMAFSEPVGRGFWLTAEYGVGKSHFLATLACLLSDDSDRAWDVIHDPDIQNYRFQFEKRRLFPVAAGLRGKTAISQDRQITLLEQLEKEIDESIGQLGLEDKINITPVAETLKLFDGLHQGLQGAINSYIQQKSGTNPSQLRKDNPALFADLIRKFFKESNLSFEPKYNINDRLLYLYGQITESNAGFNGLLIVIDEYESWLAQRPITSNEGMFDSNVLQALTEILPKQYNCEIFTVIASQTDIPAQLQGRFKNLPLLAGSEAERDYHVICAHRTRRYKEGMEPEAKLYYHDFYDEFGCYKGETEESFLETFPFHPLAYEAVRRFTSSVQDMPGVRLGLNIFYDVMKSQEALALRTPITLAHTHKYSQNLQNALAGPRFADAQRRFLDAIGLLAKVFTDDEDRIIAESILTVLFLQFVISGDQTVPMNASELAEATLTPTGPITGEQRVLVLLKEMAERVPQLEFDISQPDRGARFSPRPTGPTAQQLLDEIKAEFFLHEMEIISRWEKLLFASPAETRGQKALFSGYSIDKPLKDAVVVNQMTYDGEIVVSGSWRPELGSAIQDPYTHFRLIYLLNPNAKVAEDLRDPRIVVIEPTKLNDHLKDLCCTYMAAERLKRDYDPQKQKGPEAAEVRAFAELKLDEALSDVLRYQLEPFQKGKAYTQKGINLDVLSALSKPTPDQRHAALLRPTLEDAFYEFSDLFESHKITKPVVIADSKNLIMGLIQGNSSKAVQSTLDQKAVGLCLVSPEEPHTLNARHSKVFKKLDERLEKAPAVPIWPLIKELAGCPYGFPPHLFTAQLLCYVRYRSLPSPVEIQLHPQHNVTNQNGQPLSINRITRSNVVDLRWQSGIEKYFDSLVAVRGPDWNSLQPYARLLYPDAKTASTPREIDQQIENFISYLKNQLSLLKEAKTNLNTLAASVGGSLSVDDSELFDKFVNIFEASDLEDFDSARKGIGADQSGFKEMVDRMNALRALSSTSSQIIQMHNTLKEADCGVEDELSSLKDLLLDRYSLPQMIGNTIAVSDLLNDTEKFLARVKTAQDVHANRVQEVLQKLRDFLKNSYTIIEGLGKLNEIDALGPAQGHEFADHFESIFNRVEKEFSGESKLYQKLSYEPPEEEVKELHQRIRGTFEKRVNLLRSQLEMALQGQEKRDDLETLLELLHSNKLDEVSKNLTPDIIETIKNVLEEARTQIIRSYALDQVLEQFPALSKDKMDDFLKELRKLLESEFAQKGEEGKKILLSFK